MRIYFGVSGVGRGHAMRSGRLAKELIIKGHEIFVSSYGDGLEAIKRVGLSENVCEVTPYEYVWHDKGLDWSLTIVKSIFKSKKFLNHFIDELSCISKTSPDFVVSDSRVSTLIASKILRIPVSLITNQLSIFHVSWFLRRLISIGFSSIWNLSDKILVTDLPPPYTISYVNIVPYMERYDEKIHFVGLLDDLSKYVEIVNKDERDIDVTFIISAPRSDRLRFGRSIIKLVKLLSKKGLRIVVLGEDMFHYKSNNVSFLGWVEDPLVFIRNSRSVFVRGGQTSILEAIMASTPLLVSPAPRQTEQEGNAVSVKRNNIGELVPYDVLVDDPEYAARTVFKFLENLDPYYDEVQKARHMGFKIGGIRKAIEILLKMD